MKEGKMSKVYAGNLAGKETVTVEGKVLGEVENMTFDTLTGKLIDLMVKPDSELMKSRFREEGKYILIPFGSVCAVKDYIVVDEKKAVKTP